MYVVIVGGSVFARTNKETARFVSAALQRFDEGAPAVHRYVLDEPKRCVIGKPCPEHDNAVHGREAEELRAGIEKLISESAGSSVTDRQLHRLLDRTDARDSVAFLENKPKRKAKKAGRK
jgi:hypothetical protein